MKSNLLFTVILATMLASSVGCAKKPDDATISSDIQNKFSQDSGLSSKQLSVQSSAGVVTLAGTVDTQAQRDAASRQAASVAGVKEVVNNLQVGNAASAPPSSTPPASSTTMMKPSPSPTADLPKSSPPKKSHKSPEPDQSTQSASNDNPPPAKDSTQTTTSNDTAPPPAPPIDNTPPPAAVPPPPPAPKKLIIDQGTQLTVRLVDSIDSEKNQTGDTFHATLNAPLSSDGEEAVPAGTDLTGHLVEVKSAGKFAGQADLVLQLDSITSGGKTYNLQTDTYRKDGTSRGKNTAEKVGGGAILGGIIGAIAGGGKGAAIGAAAGAGAGGAVQAASKKQQIKLPSETVLNFTLQAPITVVQPSSSDRPKLGTAQ
jgi:BON domain